MSHLLMIESWVGGTAHILPTALLAAGHRYTFVTRCPEHYRVGTTRAQEHPVLAHASRVQICETNDAAALEEQLQRSHARDPFDGVLTICDYYLETVVQMAGALGLPHPFPSAVGLERRKHRVRRALDGAGIPNPRYAVAQTWDAARRAAAEIGFPLIVKPTDLASSAHVRMVRDEEQLMRAFGKLQSLEQNFRNQPRDTECLLEEYLDGAEFSVETCTVDGRTTVLGVTDKGVTGAPYFIEDSHMFPARLEPTSARQLEEFATRVLDAVGHDRGIAHIEVKLTAAGPRLIEINPRMAGNYIVELIERVTGVDLLRATIDLALGKQPTLTLATGTARSAAIQFIVPQRAGLLRTIRGEEALAANRRVVRWRLDATPGAAISEPIDNACYLGHVMAVDPDGPAAREAVEEAVRGLEVVYAD